MLGAWRTLGSWHAPLAWFAASMLVLAAVATGGWVVDDRVLMGQPIWGKPLKFALSFVAYAVTLAWMLGKLERGRRIGWWAGTIVAVASALEMTAIVGQVVRGRQSHFNMATALDTLIFSAMGALVGIIYLGTLVVAVVLLRSRLRDPALSLAIRLGIFIALAGLSVGFLMLLPTPAQAEAAQPTLVGAHSVGVTDGGPGLPVLGWSTTGGDLRVSHFIGMHALQALPLLAFALSSPRARRLDDRTRSRIVLLGAGAYGGVVALTLWQALRGQPITAPDAATLLALAALLASTGLAAVAVARTARPLARASA